MQITLRGGVPSIRQVVSCKPDRKLPEMYANRSIQRGVAADAYRITLVEIAVTDISQHDGSRGTRWLAE